MSFDRVMTALDPAIVVVTTAWRGERGGCVVGFHSQCSIDPPRHAVWLSKANRTYELGVEATHFAVHLLGAGDRDLAELFGTTTGDEVDKLAECDWHEGPGGVPVLDRVDHWFAGTRAALLDSGGDHVCVVLEPVASGAPAPGGTFVPAPGGTFVPAPGGTFVPLRSTALADLDAGHPAEERRDPSE